jgi:hypothetical protein
VEHISKSKHLVAELMLFSTGNIMPFVSDQLKSEMLSPYYVLIHMYFETVPYYTVLQPFVLAYSSPSHVQNRDM